MEKKTDRWVPQVSDWEEEKKARVSQAGDWAVAGPLVRARVRGKDMGWVQVSAGSPFSRFFCTKHFSLFQNNKT